MIKVRKILHYKYHQDSIDYHNNILTETNWIASAVVYAAWLEHGSGFESTPVASVGRLLFTK